jgi:5-(aminomethyl)-3-furanmethanol phosphate kinase
MTPAPPLGPVLPIVIKVGGSLYDWPELGERLRAWLRCEVNGPALLVPGGGPLVDGVRALDQRQQLGEEKAHWLALRALSVNAWLLVQLVADAVVVKSLDGCAQVWRERRVGVLDAHAFARLDEGCEGSLPHAWAVTSDSVAARVARLLGAKRLVLLKSRGYDFNGDWCEAGRQGFVDAWFARAVGENLTVEAVNLRSWQARARP